MDLKFSEFCIYNSNFKHEETYKDWKNPIIILNDQIDIFLCYCDNGSTAGYKET